MPLHPCFADIANRLDIVNKSLRQGSLSQKDGLALLEEYTYVYDATKGLIGKGRSGAAEVGLIIAQTDRNSNSEPESPFEGTGLVELEDAASSASIPLAGNGSSRLRSRRTSIKPQANQTNQQNSQNSQNNQSGKWVTEVNNKPSTDNTINERKGPASNPAPTLPFYIDPRVDPADGEDTICFTVSVLEEDRDGDVVVPLGCHFQNFSKNPGFYFGHQQWEIPVGQARSSGFDKIYVWPEEKKLRSACRFDRADPDADYIYGKVRRGLLNSTSIAFVPLVASRRDGRDIHRAFEGDKARPHHSPMMPPGWLFAEYDLTEISIVGVPSNAGAIRDSLDTEGKFLSPRLQKGLATYAAQPKGYWNGWCVGPGCPTGCNLEQTTKEPNKPELPESPTLPKVVQKGLKNTPVSFQKQWLKNEEATRTVTKYRIDQLWEKQLKERTRPKNNLNTVYKDFTEQEARTLVEECGRVLQFTPHLTTVGRSESHPKKPIMESTGVFYPTEPYTGTAPRYGLEIRPLIDKDGREIGDREELPPGNVVADWLEERGADCYWRGIGGVEFKRSRRQVRKSSTTTTLPETRKGYTHERALEFAKRGEWSSLRQYMIDAAVEVGSKEPNAEELIQSWIDGTQDAVRILSTHDDGRKALDHLLNERLATYERLFGSKVANTNQEQQGNNGEQGGNEQDNTNIKSSPKLKSKSCKPCSSSKPTRSVKSTKVSKANKANKKDSSTTELTHYRVFVNDKFWASVEAYTPRGAEDYVRRMLNEPKARIEAK